MLIHFILIVEIVSSLLCIHCIYNKRLKINLYTILAFMGILAVLEFINFYHISGIYSMIGYMILCIYCIIEFKSSILEAIISVGIYIIILTILQFLCISIVNIFLYNRIELRNALGNILMLGIIYWKFPKIKINNLKISILNKNRIVILVLSYIVSIVFILWLHKKLYNEIQIQYYVFSIPVIIILVIMTTKWYINELEIKKLNDTVNIIVKNGNDEYKKLLYNVRIRQHAFKNHIEAIFATHYTYKTYDKLVEAQERYCKRLLDDNKYNSILTLGDQVLSGFLYQKFEEAINININIDYKADTVIESLDVQIYYVIEMLGILIDNAIEAVIINNDKVILFEIHKINNAYEFVIMNPNTYVDNEAILSWFDCGYSNKGKGRGFGLFRIKELCEKLGCCICCNNCTIGDKNWIEFILIIKKGS